MLVAGSIASVMGTGAHDSRLNRRYVSDMTAGLVPLIFSSSWASGVNAWITVFVLGCFARFGDTEVVPEGFGHTAVLVGSGALMLVELVLDKIPWVDSLWDSVSTAVRPTVAAVIAYQLADGSGAVDQALLTALGGGTALASHSVKSGVRLAANSSPEPASNIILSTLEDLSVLGVIVLAIHHPWWALGVTASLLVIGIVTLVLLIGVVRPAIRSRRERRATAHAP